MKNYIGFVRDHSASMRTIAQAAARDYNENIKTIKEEAIKHSIDTIVSVVECGYGNTRLCRPVILNSSVLALADIQENAYQTDGNGTPLYDSVGMLIDALESAPDVNDKDVSFLVFVTTDGAENCSTKWNSLKLNDKMRKLKDTDRWTFVFRVPVGSRPRLVAQGIPEGNIIEWEQTTLGVETSMAQTKSAVSSYYSARSVGATSTDKFYVDASNISLNTVKNQLVDVTAKSEVYVVDKTNDGVQIRDFVEAQGYPYVKGCAYYQLSKPEKVQDHKNIALRDKFTGNVYVGLESRSMLGLPEYGEVKVAPADSGQYNIFIQSTSVNRKLVDGTNILIMK